MLRSRTTASEEGFRPPGALFRSQHLGSYRFDRSTRLMEPSPTQRLGYRGIYPRSVIVGG